jgi:hypothetical protein
VKPPRRGGVRFDVLRFHLIVALTLSAAAGAAVTTLRGSDDRAAPTGRGAYAWGGAPDRDPGLERFLVDELTALVIETDADRRGSREGAPRAHRVAELRHPPRILAYGPALAATWYALIDALDRWVDVPARGRRLSAAVDELAGRARAVSAQLAALGLGYHVQADVIVRGRTANAVLFVYAVERVALVRAGDTPHRVLELRRLDRLNLAHALLGRQSDAHGDPVVLLDQIENLVEAKLWPVLSPGAPYRLGDVTRGGAGWQLAVAAGDAVRRELQARLDGVPEGDHRRQVRELVIATVRRHEARHAVDHARRVPLRYPQALAELVGEARDPGRRRFALRARAELAGYLGQIANDPDLPHFSLWNLTSLALHRERWGSAEAYVAVVILEGLARQLGSRPARPLVWQGQLDRSRLAALARPLAGMSGAALRDAAASLWQELYGEPVLPLVEVGDPGVHAADGLLGSRP